MKNIAKFSVEKAITVFMAVIIVAILGVVSFTRLTTDLFPSMNIPYSVVFTTYMGASPEEVEEIVTKPLEETFSTTTNISEVISMSQENVSILMLEFESDTNMDSAIIEMRENLDMILPSFPDEVGSPMIIKLNPDMMPIMQFSVTKGDMTQQELTTYVQDEILPDIERIGGVASVTVSGAYESEIRVVLDDDLIADLNEDFEEMMTLAGVDPEVIEEMKLDKDLISQILMAQNFEFPVGYVNVSGVDYLVRVGDEVADLEELENLLLFQLGPMAYRLGDLADITMVNANEKEYSKVNGENAIAITIQKGSNYATTDVTEEIINVLNDINEADGTDFTILLDQGEYINQATGNVVNNLLIGGVLAIIVLFVFLRSFRATFIVGVAIPISLFFAIILIYLSGITLNIVSLGGLALGIGMLVDNSIVVMENIFRLKKQGLSNREAAIKGTAQVGGAITASTLTTISVFIPIIFIEGFIREIFMQMALTITFSLLASLMIALTLVPSVSSRVLKEKDDQDRSDSTVLEKVKRSYEKTFRFAFKYKAFVLPLVLVLFIISIGLSITNGFEYFPTSDEGQLSISITNPVENPLDYDTFIDTLDNLGEELEELADVETVGITLGGGQMMMLGFTDSNAASVSVILKDDRAKTTIEMEALIDDILIEDYSTIEYEIMGTQTMTTALTGSGIQIQLKGNELETLKEEAVKIATIVQGVDGVESVDDGIGRVSKEIKITVNKDIAMANMITVGQVLGIVAETIGQETATTSITIDGHIYDIYVYDQFSNDDDTEYTKEDIEAIIVGADMLGNPITVGDVAVVDDEAEGFTTINRDNGSRTITVSANFEEGYNVSLVSMDVEEALEAYSAPDGYQMEILGENEEIMEAFEVLGLAVALGIVLIYMIMASQFQSLSYPFIIMFTSPLAFTGGFLILFIADMAVSVVSLIGLIILTGVVVNNGIVLVDYTNQLREDGMSVFDALLEAGKTRLRPIVMTALTTILALSTMAIGVGEGAEMMQPMAVTTIGGLLYATVLTLIVVPIMYYMVTTQGVTIMSILGILATITATAAAYFFLTAWYVLVIGSVLIIGIIVLWIFLSRRKKLAHE